MNLFLFPSAPASRLGVRLVAGLDVASLEPLEDVAVVLGGAAELLEQRVLAGDLPEVARQDLLDVLRLGRVLALGLRCVSDSNHPLKDIGTAWTGWD